MCIMGATGPKAGDAGIPGPDNRPGQFSPKAPARGRRLEEPRRALRAPKGKGGDGPPRGGAAAESHKMAFAKAGGKKGELKIPTSTKGVWAVANDVRPTNGKRGTRSKNADLKNVYEFDGYKTGETTKDSHGQLRDRKEKYAYQRGDRSVKFGGRNSRLRSL